MYDPQLVQPMRDELTALGVQELITPDDVDGAMRQPGTTLVFVNSVCGCAAGSARPGLRLKHVAPFSPALKERVSRVLFSLNVPQIRSVLFRALVNARPASHVLKPGKIAPAHCVLKEQTACSFKTVVTCASLIPPAKVSLAGKLTQVSAEGVYNASATWLQLANVPSHAVVCAQLPTRWVIFLRRPATFIKMTPVSVINA